MVDDRPDLLTGQPGATSDAPGMFVLTAAVLLDRALLRKATGAAMGATPSFHAPGRTAAGGGCAAKMRPPQFRRLTA
jgi:hypothetical protein